MSQISSQTLLELGESLQSSLRALVSKDGELPRPTDLARVWSLDQTLCVRTCAALRNDEPLRVLHQLPSSGGLRSIVEAGEGQGVPRKIRDAAAAAIAAETPHTDVAVATVMTSGLLFIRSSRVPRCHMKTMTTGVTPHAMASP